jgi:hypothetical protein
MARVMIIMESSGPMGRSPVAGIHPCSSLHLEDLPLETFPLICLNVFKTCRQTQEHTDVTQMPPMLLLNRGVIGNIQGNDRWPEKAYTHTRILYGRYPPKGHPLYASFMTSSAAEAALLGHLTQYIISGWTQVDIPWLMARMRAHNFNHPQMRRYYPECSPGPTFRRRLRRFRISEAQLQQALPFLFVEAARNFAVFCHAKISRRIASRFSNLMRASRAFYVTLGPVMSDLQRGEHERCEGVVRQLEHTLHSPPWHVLGDWQDFNYELYLLDHHWATQFSIQRFARSIRTKAGVQELMTLVRSNELRIPFAISGSVIKRLALNRFTRQETIRATDCFEEADHYFWNGLRHQDGIICGIFSSVLITVYSLWDVETCAILEWIILIIWRTKYRLKTLHHYWTE